MLTAQQSVDFELRPSQALDLKVALPDDAVVLAVAVNRIYVDAFEHGQLMGYCGMDFRALLPGEDVCIRCTQGDFKNSAGGEILSLLERKFEVVSAFSLSHDRTQLTFVQACTGDPDVLAGGACVRVWFSGRSELSPTGLEHTVAQPEGTSLHVQSS